MKRRTDLAAQQYRIRVESAQRCALEAWDKAMADRARWAASPLGYGEAADQELAARMDETRSTHWIKHSPLARLIVPE